MIDIEKRGKESNFIVENLFSKPTTSKFNLVQQNLES